MNTNTSQQFCNSIRRVIWARKWDARITDNQILKIFSRFDVIDKRIIYDQDWIGNQQI